MTRRAPIPSLVPRPPGAGRGEGSCGTALWRAIIVSVQLTLNATPVLALDVKLWPLIDYHRDASGQSTLHLLGPVFSYERSAEQSELTLRPLFSYTQGLRVSHNQLAVLYPIFVSRWEPEQAEYRLFGLISYRTERALRPDQWDRRFTIFPFVFYRYSRTLGTSVSVLPFYANVRDLLGYEHIQMIAFPLYLHLKEPLVERTWLPFPFVSWSGGTLGHGYRFWPVYGWDQEGETERFKYIMWPLYISRERHFTRPEREHHLIVFPFYSRIDSPTKQSRSYAGPFFTHTIDRKEQTDTWGFPWPLWLSQRDLTTGRRTSLRLAPFYEDAHFGDLHSHFVLWPAYRWETQEADSYRHTRSDIFLLLYRNIEQVQPEYRHRRHLRTLFPLYRAYAADGESELSMLATFDALFPRNPTIQRLYAPLWQLYTHQQTGDRPPRWSLLWDLISSDGAQIRYPIRLDFSE